jgi:hypothetical protein
LAAHASDKEARQKRMDKMQADRNAHKERMAAIEKEHKENMAAATTHEGRLEEIKRASDKRKTASRERLAEIDKASKERTAAKPAGRSPRIAGSNSH